MSDLEQAIERIVRRVLAERDTKPANDEYFSVAEAAAFARVSPYTIRRWIRLGELTRHEAGARVLVKREEIASMITADVDPSAKMTPGERARRRFG